MSNKSAITHVVLLGDSIFDNAVYVPPNEAVIDLLNQVSDTNFRYSLCAVDGAVTRNVLGQLDTIPKDASHLVVSCGGNDALGYAGLLKESSGSVARALEILAVALEQFRNDYSNMLEVLLSLGKKTVVCTIYNRIPGMERGTLTAIGLFNDVILAEAFKRGVAVVDLRLVCDEVSDYSTISPIEPSSNGGRKIVRTILQLLQRHDFACAYSCVYH